MNNLLAWARAHKVWAAVIAVLLVGFVCGGISSAIGGGKTSTAVVATDTPAKPQPTHPKPTATPLPRVGSSITVDGVTATLVKVQPIQGDDFNQPKAGNEFIIVTVKLANHSGSEFTYSSADFHIRSSGGNVTDAEIIAPSTYTANNLLDANGNLTNGGSVTADVCLQAPTGDHGAKLTWQPGFGNNGDNGWLLGL